MRKVTTKTEKAKPVKKTEEVVLDDAEIPFPASNSTPEEVAEFFDDAEDASELGAEISQGRITRVVYKTNRNLGNQEHESVELESTVGESEEVSEVFDYLKETAKYLLNG